MDISGRIHRYGKKAVDTSLVLMDQLFFAFYRLIGRFRRHDRVKSVLQLSIISHKPYMISRAMRKAGLNSSFLALNTDIGWLSIGYDYALPAKISPVWRRLRARFLLWFVMARFDVIHSHFLASITEDGLEFSYLKRLGKVIVFHFRGCDLRQKSINLQKNPDLNCCQECSYPEGSCDTDYQRQRIATAERYGDLFFVTTPDMIDFMDKAEHIPFIYPNIEGFDQIEPAPRDPAVFRVVTSSNHHGVDGTEYIRQAVKQLQDEGAAIELVEVAGMPYREALAMYKSGDVYAGKLRMGYYNNANIETMLMGIPNMCYVRDVFLKKIPDSPIIVTRPETVYRNLKEWLPRREELRALGERSRQFVLRHHDPDMIVALMIQRYNEAYTAKVRKRVCSND